MNIICQKCKKEINASVNFCPYCGHELNLPNTPLTSGKKTRIYLMSFFLSPFGLIWFFKYFRSKNLENRKVAYIVLIVTLVPLVFSLIVGGRYISSISGIVDLYKANLSVYSDLGL